MIALLNLFQTVRIIVQNGIYDFNIKAKEFKKSNDYYHCYENTLEVHAPFNKNIEKVATIIQSTISGLSISSIEKEYLTKLNIDTYEIVLNNKSYYLRGIKSIAFIRHLFVRVIPFYALHFKIENGLQTFDNYSDVILNKGSRGLNSFQSGGIGIIRDYDPVLSSSYPVYTSYNTFVESMDSNEFQAYYRGCGYKEGLDWVRAYQPQGFSVNININFNEASSTAVVFSLKDILNINELEKISEYKVSPVIFSSTNIGPSKYEGSNLSATPPLSSLETEELIRFHFLLL